MNTVEEILKKALEYAYQGMEKYKHHEECGFVGNLYYAYKDMAAHLEMLIKEAKQNG